MKRPFLRTALLTTATTVALYLGLTDRTPRGTECRQSTSSDGRYTAESCLLKWIPGGNSERVGRLFDAQTGTLLAQRTFSAPVGDLSWSRGVTYSLNTEGPRRHIGPSVVFATEGDAYVPLPPTLWDRLLAARPRE